MTVLYWARIEAYYREIPDLLAVPGRKLLNLVLNWMMEHTDGEVWARDFRPIFFPDPGEIAREASKAQLAPAVKGQQGSLNIARKDAVPVTDLSAFLGRAGQKGKSDPNKAAAAAIAKGRSIKIAPDADGNLTIDAPDGS